MRGKKKWSGALTTLYFVHLQYTCVVLFVFVSFSTLASLQISERRAWIKCIIKKAVEEETGGGNGGGEKAALPLPLFLTLLRPSPLPSSSSSVEREIEVEREGERERRGGGSSNN